MGMPDYVPLATALLEHVEHRAIRNGSFDQLAVAKPSMDAGRSTPHGGQAEPSRKELYRGPQAQLEPRT